MPREIPYWVFLIQRTLHDQFNLEWHDFTLPEQNRLIDSVLDVFRPCSSHCRWPQESCICSSLSLSVCDEAEIVAITWEVAKKIIRVRSRHKKVKS